MSSGSNDANIANLLEQLVNQGEIDPLSDILRDSLDEFIRAQVKVEDAQRLTAKEIKDLHTSIKRYLDVIGVQTSQQFKGLLGALKEGAVKEASEGSSIGLEKLLDAFSNRISSSIIQSEKVGEKGGKGAHIKNGKESEAYVKIAEELSKKMGLSDKIDRFSDKLLTFFGEKESRDNKKQKSFVADLLEGIEKSRIGGMVKDAFSLLGLLGGNWLTEKLTPLLGPELARTVGAAFTMAMMALGGPLTNMLFSGLAKFLTPMLGPIVGFLAGIGGAVFAFKEAIDSWKNGKKGQAVSFAAGAITLLAGGIAAAIAAPIAGPLLAIGAAITGITLIWKKYGDNIKDWALKHIKGFDKVLEFFGNVKKAFKDFKDRLFSVWPLNGRDKEEEKKRKEEEKRAKKEKTESEKTGFFDGVKSMFSGGDKPKTKKVNGVEAVPMASLGLSGTIWEKNSKPYVASENAAKLQLLDMFAKSKGYDVIYTSAMGGDEHKEGSGHYSGRKVDLQPTKNGKFVRFTPEEEAEAIRLGLWSADRKGAVGWEDPVGTQLFGHYDANVAGGINDYAREWLVRNTGSSLTPIEQSVLAEKHNAEVKEKESGKTQTAEEKAPDVAQVIDPIDIAKTVANATIAAMNPAAVPATLAAGALSATKGTIDPTGNSDFQNALLTMSKICNMGG